MILHCQVLRFEILSPSKLNREPRILLHPGGYTRYFHPDPAPPRIYYFLFPLVHFIFGKVFCKKPVFNIRITNSVTITSAPDITDPVEIKGNNIVVQMLRGSVK